MSSIAERSAAQLKAKNAKIKAMQDAKLAEEEAMLAKANTPKSKPLKKPAAAASAVSTAFSKGSADEKAAKEADANAERRESLKAKTDAILARKQERMAAQAKMNADVQTLNSTAASLYGTEE